jgi:selT/selW/selH-like putative selenoprotein
VSPYFIVHLEKILSLLCFQLISTGAFEISLNDMPLWSKLESGRIPQPGELLQIIGKQPT